MKTILIIGGSGGIGFPTAKLLAEKNMRVYATYASIPPKEEIRGCTFLPCDVRKESDIDAVLESIQKEGKDVEVLINASAPPLKLKLFENITLEEFEEDVEVMVFGMVSLCRKIIPKMKERKSGLIVGLLSETLDSIPSRMSSYVTAKGGLLALMKSFHTELHSFGIRVVSLFPPMVDTPLIEAFPQKLVEIEKSKGRVLSPEKVAEKILEIIEHPEKFPGGREIKLYGDD